MRIAVAQIQSHPGKVKENILHHVRFVDRAVELGVGALFFPELSLTNYEPKFAADLATSPNDEQFSTFQDVVSGKGISVGVGMPLKQPQGICIGMLMFQPHKPIQTYAKQCLHEDEFPYFVCGDAAGIFEIYGIKIAVGICYETLQRNHMEQAARLGADIYIASVAKPQGGVEKAYVHFPEMAKSHDLPILMSNAVGPCDDFLSSGQSAVWNSEGERLGQFGQSDEGLLIYDVKTEQVEVVNLML